MSNLKMWSNGYDFIIAETERQAKKFLIETCGQLDQETIEGDGWHFLKNNENFNYWDGDQTIVKTVEQWCNEHGSGYFATTEY